jgi:F-type H+-transporting ATPase subunit delta
MNTNTDSATHHETVMDAVSQRVARVYAESLLGAAEQLNQTDQVMDELGALFEEVFRAGPLFEAFLTSGAISRKPKAEAIRKAFEGKTSELFLNFLLVLNDHQRLDLLRVIYQAARELRDERAGRLPVVVTTAAPLADDQREQLLHDLRARYNKEPVLTLRVDPALLGGLVVRVGDWLFDASVRTRLENIRKQLIERGRHATV